MKGGELLRTCFLVQTNFPIRYFVLSCGLLPALPGRAKSAIASLIGLLSFRHGSKSMQYRGPVVTVGTGDAVEEVPGFLPWNGHAHRPHVSVHGYHGCCTG